VLLIIVRLSEKAWLSNAWLAKPESCLVQMLAVSLLVGGMMGEVKNLVEAYFRRERPK